MTCELHCAKRSYFQKLNPKNPKEFWKAIKYLSKKQSSIPILTDEDGKEAATGLQKADMLNSFFSKCFNPSSTPLKDWSESDILPDPGELPDELACDEDSVCELLATLDVTKSSGPDGISGRMLKHTSVSIASSVTQLFNLSVKSGRYPEDGNCYQLCLFPSQRKLTRPTTTDSYLYCASSARKPYS